MYLKGEIIIMKKIKEFFADMTETKRGIKR